MNYDYCNNIWWVRIHCSGVLIICEMILTISAVENSICLDTTKFASPQAKIPNAIN